MACQKVVAMVTSNLMDKHLLCQKVTKFGGFSLLLKKYKRQKSAWAQLPPPQPSLNEVKIF